MLALAFALSSAHPAHALRMEAPAQGAGLEELESRLREPDPDSRGKAGWRRTVLTIGAGAVVGAAALVGTTLFRTPPDRPPPPAALEAVPPEAPAGPAQPGDARKPELPSALPGPYSPNPYALQLPFGLVREPDGTLAPLLLGLNGQRRLRLIGATIVAGERQEFRVPLFQPDLKDGKPNGLWVPVPGESTRERIVKVEARDVEGFPGRFTPGIVTVYILLDEPRQGTRLSDGEYTVVGIEGGYAVDLQSRPQVAGQAAGEPGQVAPGFPVTRVEKVRCWGGKVRESLQRVPAGMIAQGWPAGKLRGLVERLAGPDDRLSLLEPDPVLSEETKMRGHFGAFVPVGGQFPEVILDGGLTVRPVVKMVYERSRVFPHPVVQRVVLDRAGAAGIQIPPAPEKQGGLEENVWPRAEPLAFEKIEPILILRAEGGFGDIAYLIKMLDAFNARGITPVVALVGPPEKQAEARGKLDQLRQDIPVTSSFWREQDGRLVQEDGRPVEGDRPLRPVLIQHFSQVNPGWARDTADRIVPDLFQPLYRQPDDLLLIGYNAPGNVFGGYLHPGQGEYLNLYLTPPSAAGAHEPHPIFTGHLLDRPLRAFSGEIRSARRAARRAAALDRLSAKARLPSEARAAAEEANGWATLYTSQGGSLRQMECLIEAFQAVHGTATFFTFFGKNDKLWYYPSDYWQSHGDLVAALKARSDVGFMDLTTDPGTGRPIFGSEPKGGAPIQVVNLPALPMGTIRSLMGASDLALAPGHNTLMETMGMAVSKAGPRVVLSFPVFQAERDGLKESLRSVGARRTLAEIAAFDRLREPGASDEEYQQAVSMLTHLLGSEGMAKRFQRDIGRLAGAAMERSGLPSDGNMGNRLMDLLIRAEQGMPALQWASASSPSADVLQAYQRVAEAGFRAGQEPARPPISSGLEEGETRADQKILSAIALEAGVAERTVTLRKQANPQVAAAIEAARESTAGTEATGTEGAGLEEDEAAALEREVSEVLAAMDRVLVAGSLNRMEEKEWRSVYGDLKGRLRLLPTAQTGDADRRSELLQTTRDLLTAARALAGLPVPPSVVEPAADTMAATAGVLQALKDAGVQGGLRAEGWVSLEGIAGFGQNAFLIHSDADAVKLSGLSRLILQEGMDVRPRGVRVIHTRAVSAMKGLRPILERLAPPVSGSDGILYNRDHLESEALEITEEMGLSEAMDIPTLVEASLPELKPDAGRPGILVLRRSWLDELRFTEMLFLLAISQRIGPLYDYKLRLTRVTKGEQTYLLVQA